MPVISYNVSNDSPIKMPLYYSMRLYYIITCTVLRTLTHSKATAQVFNKTVFSARVPLHGYSSLYIAVLAAQLHNTPYACRSSFDVC